MRKGRRKSRRSTGRTKLSMSRGRFTGPRPSYSRNIGSYHPWVGADNGLHFPMVKALKILPARKKASLIYQTSFIVTPGTAVSTTEYRGNGPFDPEVALGGQQPRGYDQYAALYGKCYVVKSNISVAMKNVAGSSDVYVVAVYPYADASGDMPAITLASNPADWYAQSRVKVVMPSTADASSDTQMIRSKCTSKQALGKGQDRDNVVADVGGVPLTEWYWSVNTARYADTTITDPQEVVFIVTVVYDCIFSEPINVSES